MSTSTPTGRSGTRSPLRAWPASPAVALLTLRVAIGAVFIAHGAQKVFVYGFAGTSGAFAEMGVPLATVAGPLVGLVELIGGVLLVVGLAARVVAAALAVDMLVATILVHIPFGIFVAEGGYELTLTLAASALTFVLAGPGHFSIDALLTQSREGGPAALEAL